MHVNAWCGACAQSALPDLDMVLDVSFINITYSTSKNDVCYNENLFA